MYFLRTRKQALRQLNIISGRTIQDRKIAKCYDKNYLKFILSRDE